MADLIEGTKYDQEKDRWDLLPWGSVEEIVKVYTGGAKKYDDWNWAKGIKYSRIFSAVMRHLVAFWWHKKKINTDDFNLHHLAHAAWGIFTLLHYEMNYEQYKSFDDRR